VKALQRSLGRLQRRAWFAAHGGQFARRSEGGRPRLLVDLSVIARHDARTGIQRVVRAIWSELSRRAHPVYDFVPVYAGLGHGYCHAYVDPATGGLQLTREPVGCGAGDKFLGLDLTAHYLPHCIPQLSAWRQAGATVHTVVYDLLPLQQPDWFTSTTQRHFARWFRAVAQNSDQLLCISETVAREVRARLAASGSPAIGRLQLSGNIAGSSPSRGISPKVASLLAQLTTRPAILMVGTVEPRKGYDAALGAFDRLWQECPDRAPDLIIVGKAGWRTTDLQDRLRRHPLSGSRLHWLTRATDEEVTELYESCLAVLVTSRAEGFGLPLSEAAFHRKWVLARDLSVFREQGLANCLFFGADDPVALGDATLKLAELAANGPPPASSLPDWSDCLDRLLVSLGIDADRPIISGKGGRPLVRVTSG
jgi:glycosyltransferase involved in cell wall biosynthesis